jgi:RNase H-fold protein (predicted Holliday junction resolvase)
LNGGEYFDFFKKQKGELKLFQLKKVVATENSKVIVLAYQNHMEYADSQLRDKDAIYETIMRLLPNLAKFTMTRRYNTIEQFHEVIHESGTLLELEDTHPKYIYILLEGVLSFYKRPESLYTENGKRIDSSDIDHMKNPLDAGEQNIGIEISQISNQTIVCEDAVVFRQPLSYSLKTSSRVIALRCLASSAYTWSDEIKNVLKVNSLDK